MNDPIPQFIERARRLRLTQAEKATLEQTLLAFARENPVRNAEVRGHVQKRSLQSFLFFIPNLVKQPMPAVLLIIVLFFAAGGGVSFAAEQALPGDLLYSMKVNVNEEIRAALAVSPEADAAWAAERLERRLQEAEELASHNALNADARARIERNFEAHAARVELRITELEERGNVQAVAELSSNFEVSLQAHERILESFAASEAENAADESEGEVAELLVAVKAHHENASSARRESEEAVAEGPHPDVQAAAEGRLGAAENKIAEVETFIGKMQETLGEDETEAAEARLAEAKDSLARGKAKLDAGEYGEAFALFQEAHRIAQEAKLLIEARGRLDGNISFDEDDDATEAGTNNDEIDAEDAQDDEDANDEEGNDGNGNGNENGNGNGGGHDGSSGNGAPRGEHSAGGPIIGPSRNGIFDGDVRSLPQEEPANPAVPFLEVPL